MPANLPRLGDGAGGGQKVSGRRKDPLASRYSGLRIRERPSGIFSYYLEAAIHLSSPFSPFSLDFAVSFVYPTSPRCPIFRPRATGYRIFEWLSRSRKAIVEHEIIPSSTFFAFQSIPWQTLLIGKPVSHVIADRLVSAVTRAHEAITRTFSRRICFQMSPNSMVHRVIQRIEHGLNRETWIGPNGAREIANMR